MSSAFPLLSGFEEYRRMNISPDFIEWLGCDMSLNIFSQLDDPADLVRISCVSRAWRQFVIENELCKELCIGMFPELLCFNRVVEVNNFMRTMDAESSNYVERKSLEINNRVYARLAQGLKYTARDENCISEAIYASSTDNYPDERIDNTLESGDIVRRRPSYWSSQGASDPNAPETLTYKLCSKLCIVDEINIRPFRAFFQYGDPIYSAKTVRFKMGYSKMPVLSMSNPMVLTSGEFDDNDFVWTYISPEFPMVQENRLQSFKLPQPALCIGGILQVELLGRIQKQDMDGLYYICICHVQVVGRPLSPAFDVDVQTSGIYTLKHLLEVGEEHGSPQDISSDEVSDRPRGWFALASRIRESGEQTAAAIGGSFLSALLGNVHVGNNSHSDDDDDEEDDDDDDDAEMMY